MTLRVEELAKQGDKRGLRIVERNKRAQEEFKDHLPKNVAKIESRIARLERRIKNIDDNPDPNRPAVNKARYRNIIESQKKFIKAWTTGSPPIAAGMITDSMGFEHGYPGHLQLTTQEESKNYFDYLRRMGYNTNSCDVAACTPPAVFLGDQAVNEFISADVTSCYPIILNNLLIAHLTGTAMVAYDKPPQWNEDALIYMAQQVEEEIDYLQFLYPEYKFSMDRLIEQQDFQKQSCAIARQLYDLKRRAPCPVTGLDAISGGGGKVGAGTTEEMQLALDIQRMGFEEIQEKSARGFSAVERFGVEEKARIGWCVSNPFYYDPFTFLEKLGVAMPVWAVDSFEDLYSGRSPDLGAEEFGRKLTPLEEVARKHNAGWGDRGHHYLNSVINCAKDLHLDGIVFFKQTGCQPICGLGTVLAERAEQELGIPTLQLEGRQLDQSGFDERELLSTLVDFTNIMFARQQRPPLSQKDLERAGYTDGTYKGWR